MDKICIKGQKELYGEIKLSGAKNACLTLMPLSILTSETLKLSNVPNLSDIRTMQSLLKSLGCSINYCSQNNSLDLETKKLVVRAIGSLTEIPLEAVLNVAKDLEKKVAFIPETKEFSRGGGESMAKILGQMSEDDAKLYLEQIEQEDPKLYEDIRKYFYTFEDLLGLPKEKMRELFNAVEVDDIPLAFKGQEDKLNMVIETLPPKKQKMVEPITTPRPKAEVDGAKKKVLDIAKQMEKEGKITIEDLVGGEMI